MLSWSFKQTHRYTHYNSFKPTTHLDNTHWNHLAHLNTYTHILTPYEPNLESSYSPNTHTYTHTNPSQTQDPLVSFLTQTHLLNNANLQNTKQTLILMLEEPRQSLRKLGAGGTCRAAAETQCLPLPPVTNMHHSSQPKQDGRCTRPIADHPPWSLHRYITLSLLFLSLFILFT